MSRVNIYVRVQDEQKFEAIENIPEWLHAAIQRGHTDGAAPETGPRPPAGTGPRPPVGTGRRPPARTGPGSAARTGLGRPAGAGPDPTAGAGLGRPAGAGPGAAQVGGPAGRGTGGARPGHLAAGGDPAGMPRGSRMAQPARGARRRLPVGALGAGERRPALRVPALGVGRGHPIGKRLRLARVHRNGRDAGRAGMDCRLRRGRRSVSRDCCCSPPARPGAGRLQSSRPAPRSGALMSPVPGVPSASP